MTSNHDRDAFEHRFETAVNDAHYRSERGAAPSSQAWETIRAGLSHPRAEAADPRALGPDPAPVSRRTQRTRKESDMDVALNPEMAASPPRANRGIFAWATLVLVGVLVTSSLIWNGQLTPGDDGNELAWAPGLGTPESSIEPESPIASPYVYEYGPEYACEVEPLTADQVMEMVLNPLHGYEQRGREFTFDLPRSEYWEQPPTDATIWANVSMGPVFGTELSHQLEELGNEFWNCLLTGTTFQVWAMMDPTVLQWSILKNFPVLRAEEDIREFIEEWGPQNYGSSGLETFPILTGLPPEEAIWQVSSSDGAIRTGTPRGIEGQQTRIGVITMVPASGNNDLNYYELYVSEHPDGTWTVNGIGANPNLPRG